MIGLSPRIQDTEAPRCFASGSTRLTAHASLHRPQAFSDYRFKHYSASVYSDDGLENVDTRLK